MIEQNLLDCLNNLIINIYKSNKNAHNSSIGITLYNILMGEDSNNKRIFFDNFKDAPVDDKNTIINFVIATIINRISIILDNIDISKITPIINYIENKNEYQPQDIIKIISKDEYEGLPKELDIIKKLNQYEQLFTIGIFYNTVSFTAISISNDINLIRQNKDTFLQNISQYKDIVIELLSFYTSIHHGIDVKGNIDKLLNVNIDKSYIKVTFLTEFLETIIKSNHEKSNPYKKNYKFEIIYYIIYQFLLCKDDIENLDIRLVNIAYEVLNGNDPSVSFDEYTKLLEYYKFATEYYSLEDKISKIRFYRQQNLSETMNSYTSMDIVRYNELQKRKKQFGL